MLILRCTTKAFKKIGIKPQSVEVNDSSPTLGEWYVGTIDFLNRGDLLLLAMHAASRYAMLLPFEAAPSPESLARVFHSQLLARLASLETPPAIALQILHGYGDTTVLAKSNCRKATGHVTTIVRDMEGILENPGDVVRDDSTIIIPAMEHRLNETPRGSTKDYVWPLQEFWACLCRLCPELPPRRSLGLWTTPDRQGLTKSIRWFRKHLPERLVCKLEALLHPVDILFTTDELTAIQDVLIDVSRSALQACDEFLANLDRQITANREAMQRP